MRKILKNEKKLPPSNCYAKTIGTSEKELLKQGRCPECGYNLIKHGNCWYCVYCGWSSCQV